ncbi:T9SS type A sorting domain-containing protein [bacterium AH-315-C20]|nr:T9SS type A sorting domain-containing protein [bacterium AH-315-C20]
MKVLLKISSLLILLAVPVFGVGQVNLVPNPSFEDSSGCPIAQGMIELVDDWYSPTNGTPDYQHSCHAGTSAGVPQNGFGWQMARTGEAYVGGHANAFTGTDVREYVQAQLVSPLEVNAVYEVRFYLSHADSSQRTCDNFGAYFSASPVSQSDAKNLPYIPQIISESGMQLNDKFGWMEVKDTMISVGGENYITLGIFDDDATTNWEFVGGGWEAAAHYYIDDVSVIKIGTVGYDDPNNHPILTSNPLNQTITVSSSKLITQILVMDLSGQLVLRQNLYRQNNAVINLGTIKSGIYVLAIVYDDNHVFKTKISN